MKVLGIETATGVCGVAVVEEEVLLAERWSSEQHIHSERIVRSVQVVLSESHLELREVDVIAVSIGPGSFTGLRIGLSAAKGLCYASGKPLVAVPTLDALAHRVVGLCEEGKIVCTVLDAKRDEVYSAWYERRGPRMERKSDYQVLHREEFLKRLRSMSSVMLTGEDAGRSIDRIKILKR
ncbi:MAG: tRNA (adenosine(37)-N6)-threonylcarbamoyltransferase complex dimerization subunit type 1 TsaB, partial [Bacteroidota bacterium]